MSQRQPLFAGLIYNEEGEPVQTKIIGGEPFYAIPEGDFLRHIEAIEVDRQIVHHIQERILEIKDIVIEGAMQMLGSDDPFTRAAIEMSLENMDRLLEPGAVPTEDLQLGLWMTGFRVTVDLHGQVVWVQFPGLDADG
jgi:hypothetical protein